MWGLLFKVETREQPVLQGAMIYMFVSVGSVCSNRKNDENGIVWVRWGLTLKLEKNISTCYRLGRGSPVYKVEAHEFQDPQGPKSGHSGGWGQCKCLSRKIGDVVEYG